MRRESFPKNKWKEGRKEGQFPSANIDAQASLRFAALMCPGYTKRKKERKERLSFLSAVIMLVYGSSSCSRSTCELQWKWLNDNLRYRFLVLFANRREMIVQGNFAQVILLSSPGPSLLHCQSSRQFLFLLFWQNIWFHRQNESILQKKNNCCPILVNEWRFDLWFGGREKIFQNLVMKRP